MLVSIIAEDPNVYEEMVQLCESYFDSALKNSFVKEYVSPFITLIAPSVGVYVGAAYGLAISTNDTLEWTWTSSFITIILLSVLFLYLVNSRRNEREFEFYFILFLKKLKSLEFPPHGE